MVIPKNRNAVLAILKELEPRILGKSHKGFICNCGQVSIRPGKAVAVEPGGDDYPGQETVWFFWDVKVSNHPEKMAPHYDYTTTLDLFMPVPEIESIFLKHFGPAENKSHPYDLPIKPSARAFGKLPPAVRIKDNDLQTRFCFDWGNAQDYPSVIYDLFEPDSRKILSGTPEFIAIIAILRRLRPMIYRGGPNPVLPFESAWLMDYSDALDQVSKNAHSVFTQGNVSQGGGPQGFLQLSGHIVFMKVK